jgi:hypothetical protein
MSATTVPLVAAMLLTAAIETAVVDDNCQTMILIISPFCFVYFTSYIVFRYQRRKIRLAIG